MDQGLRFASSRDRTVGALQVNNNRGNRVAARYLDASQLQSSRRRQTALDYGAAKVPAQQRNDTPSSPLTPPNMQQFVRDMDEPAKNTVTSESEKTLGEGEPSETTANPSVGKTLAKEVTDTLGETGKFVAGSVLGGGLNAATSLITGLQSNSIAQQDLDFRKEQYATDVKAAHEMGLNSPSQLTGGGPQIGKMGLRSFTMTPRTKAQSPFSF